MSSVWPVDNVLSRNSQNGSLILFLNLHLNALNVFVNALELEKTISAECNVMNLVGYYFILHCPYVKCDNKTVVYSV